MRQAGAATGGISARTIWWAGAMAALLALALPALAQARAGQLDPSFGQKGRKTIGLPNQERSREYQQLPQLAPMASTSLTGGGVVAADSSVVVELGSDGRPKAGFGENGRVSIAAPAGWEFELADLAVDSEQRVLVAGTLASLASTSTPSPPQYQAPGPRERQAVVYRLLTDGQLDPSFGNGGVLTGKFGQKPPDGPGPFDYQYSVAVVGLTGVAIAPNGSIVLSGYAAKHITGGCKPGAPGGASNRSFVARLNTNGSTDGSFGSNGVLTDEQLERLGDPAIDDSGRIVYEGESGYCGFFGPAVTEQVDALLANGGFDPAFGENGGRAFPNLELETVGFDPRGRLLVLAQAKPKEEVEKGRWLVRRLQADGSPDPSFGGSGTASPKLPYGAEMHDITVDGRGRIVLAGSVSGKGDKGRVFVLTRLSGKGKREPGFGQKGSTQTGFPSTAVEGFAVSTDKKDRIVIGGVTTDSPGFSYDGLAFARYQG